MLQKYFILTLTMNLLTICVFLNPYFLLKLFSNEVTKKIVWTYFWWIHLLVASVNKYSWMFDSVISNKCIISLKFLVNILLISPNRFISQNFPFQLSFGTTFGLNNNFINQLVSEVQFKKSNSFIPFEFT